MLEDFKVDHISGTVKFDVRRNSELNAFTPQPMMLNLARESPDKLASILKSERKKIAIASPSTLRALQRGS